jgi:hypothetical protein
MRRYVVSTNDLYYLDEDGVHVLAAAGGTKMISGRVVLNLLDMQIDHDRRQYRLWSTRAKLRRIQLSGPRVERKYVSRATPYAWTLAIRREMATVIEDLQRCGPSTQSTRTWRYRLRAWWRNVRFLWGPPWSHRS